jgi:hypothetical protein
MYRLLVLSLALLPVAALQAQPQTHPPSTAAERAKAVEFAASLESDPLGDQARERRQWLLRWLIEVPDIHVKVCSGFFGPLLGSKKNYAAELFTQSTASAAAFVISNPDKAGDDLAQYAAGLQGTLRAYESILKVKPKARWPYLDGLIEKRDKGELAEYVRQTAGHCK